MLAKKRVIVTLSILIFGIVMLVIFKQFSSHSNNLVGTADRENQVSISPKQSLTEIQQVNLILNQKELFQHIKALEKERYTESDRAKTRDYIIQALKASGWSPTLQSFDGGVNVVAERPGTDPQAGKIILAAHYDTVKNSPGVDDNASGVATVLEVAKLLGKTPTIRTLQVVFFDLEEAGLLGSFAFTKNPVNLTNLKGVIVLDMVGFACHTKGCQRYPQGLPISPPSDKGDFLTVIVDSEHLPLLQAFGRSNQTNSLPILPLPLANKGLQVPDALRSDHAPFWYKGIGAVFVTDTANFRNPHYHQPSDTLANIDRQFFLKSATIIANATATLLESRENLATN